MNKIILLCLMFILAGCATSVPVTMNFPQAPEALTKPCDPLQPLPKDKKELSDLLENANENYGKHHECLAKYRAWQEWYETQKKIFEEVK